MPAYDPEIQENDRTLTDVPATDDGLLELPVYPLIHFIRSDVEENIDTSLTWSQLTTPEINFTVVRPLVLKYAKAHNPAVVYAMLVVRSHFQSLAENNLAFTGIIQTRASLCELLAVKLLRHFTSSQVELTTVLTHPWSPLQSAPDRVVEQVKIIVGDNPAYLDEAASVLEVAISTESKHFCSSPLVQNIITDIWMGRVVFSTSSTRSLVQDNYKSKAVSIYDPRDAPFFDHYRLRVPRYRAIMEFVNFAVLLFLFIVCLSSKNLSHITASEVVFMVFVLGFMLDEFAASQEHGWTSRLFEVQIRFISSHFFIFLAYFGLRIKGIIHHDEWYSDLAFDILSCGACILFPRMAFFSISNNVGHPVCHPPRSFPPRLAQCVSSALKGMIADFLYFIAIAAICFSGLLFTLHGLAGDKWPVKDIGWLMVQIWFGNTSLSFEEATSFHPIFGPILMASITEFFRHLVLISILSNTFARINEASTEEFLFQFAISTLEGVKADAVLVYQPPFNLAAYAILSVLSWFFSPRVVHTANVFMIRVTSFPMLVAIACYERFVLPGPGLVESSKGVASVLYNIVPRQVQDLPFFEYVLYFVV
ncbi:hypothetical protein BS47DRAFT_1294946 [Hydnum rufescens UP504]|uniref:Uncharacterized protein n=1 Tax=Hydnum rufescens UP504 TaxID=1448309 RepID=A0A9P6B092_9AGAM|nr:hypothetical protein BS47DRAFT_1294946 [Hydnum rufescens UP504]